MPIEWAVAARPLPGQRCSGDLHVVEPLARGMLIAVIDGLGHGAGAASVAQAAADVVRAHADQDVTTLIRLCHERLRAGRGVVMTLASFDGAADEMTWAGIGNVEAVLVHADPRSGMRRQSLLLRDGVVGSQVPSIRSSVVPLVRGDLLLLTTDGISGGFVDSYRGGTAQEIADDILGRYAKPSDDALVFAATYVGSAP
jgi:phosphoserine phosphatase RsbX